MTVVVCMCVRMCIWGHVSVHVEACGHIEFVFSFHICVCLEIKLSPPGLLGLVGDIIYFLRKRLLGYRKIHWLGDYFPEDRTVTTFYVFTHETFRETSRRAYTSQWQHCS